MSRGPNHINGYSQRNKIKLIQAGRNYFQLLEHLINKARDTIHLQMYIFNNDDTGALIGNALIKAARRNVNVYILADGYASQTLSKTFIKKMKEAGIWFRFFQPLLKSEHFYFGRRMHEKVLVIDGKYAVVGGVNIADRYNEINGNKPWLDFSIYLEGEI